MANGWHTITSLHPGKPCQLQKLGYVAGGTMKQQAHTSSGRRMVLTCAMMGLPVSAKGMGWPSGITAV